MKALSHNDFSRSDSKKTDGISKKHSETRIQGMRPYFQGEKEQMTAAVLEYVANWLDENVFTPLQSDKPPRERILAMSQGLDEFYDSGQDPCLLSVMSVGEADNLFHQQLEQSLNHWLALLTQVVAETGVELELARQRAEDALMMIQGALV